MAPKVELMAKTHINQVISKFRNFGPEWPRGTTFDTNMMVSWMDTGLFHFVINVKALNTL